MSLSSEELASLKVCLAEAELAYHTLITGAKPVTVREPSGIEITYAVDSTQIEKLQIYIQELKSKISDESGRRPLMFLG